MKRIATALVSACLVASAANAAQEPKLIPFWNASDEANADAIDHGPWQALLTAYVVEHPSAINRFDYAALKADADDVAKLNAYLATLQAIDPRTYALAEQHAYWINLYNALTIKVVTDAYPVDSIRDIHEGWLPYTGPWDDVHTAIAEPGADPQRHRTRDTAANLAGCPHPLCRQLRQPRLPQSDNRGLYGSQHGSSAGGRGARIREPPARCRLRRRGFRGAVEHLRLVGRRFRRHRGISAGASGRIRGAGTRRRASRLRRRRRLRIRLGPEPAVRSGRQALFAAPGDAGCGSDDQRFGRISGVTGGTSPPTRAGPPVRASCAMCWPRICWLRSASDRCGSSPLRFSAPCPTSSPR